MDVLPLHRAIDADLVVLAGTDWAGLARSLHEVVETVGGRRGLRQWESPVDSIPDGFPTSASGGDGGGGSVATTSSVERATEARVRHKDPVDMLVRNAVTYLGDAARSARAAQVMLNKVAGLRDPAERGSVLPGCWALARVGGWEPVHATTVVDGGPVALGRWAYDFVRRTGVIPSSAQCRAHLEGRKVYIKP